MASAQLFRATQPDHHHHHLCITTKHSTPLHRHHHFSSLFKQLNDQLRLPAMRCLETCARITCHVTRLKASASVTSSNKTSDLADMNDWDNLGFDPIPTDFIYVMKCSGGEEFQDGGLHPYAKIGLNPFSSVLNYGQGIIEGLKAYRKEEDDSILLFRPKENGLRMREGADRMCMTAPSIDQFVEAVKLTVLANKRWIPPSSKGFLHIRPLLFGSGAALALMPSPEFTFLVYVTPVGSYFQGGMKPINLVIDNETSRAVPGGVGSIKAIGNYAVIMKSVATEKANGFDDVVYLDAVHNRYLEEASTANVFVVKDKTICTPALKGTVLPGITRASIIQIARNEGFKVEERLVTVEELFGADEVFCTGNAIGVIPVGSITCLGKRLSYRGGGPGTLSHQLYSALTSIQMGLAEDKMGWTVILK